MSLIREDGVIRAPHVLVTIALPADGGGLDVIHGTIDVGGTVYVATTNIDPDTHYGHEYIGVVTACTIENP